MYQIRMILLLQRREGIFVRRRSYSILAPISRTAAIFWSGTHHQVGPTHEIWAAMIHPSLRKKINVARIKRAYGSSARTDRGGISAGMIGMSLTVTAAAMHVVQARVEKEKNGWGRPVVENCSHQNEEQACCHFYGPFNFINCCCGICWFGERSDSNEHQMRLTGWEPFASGSTSVRDNLRGPWQNYI